MEKIALFVRMEARPGKEKEVSEFIQSALALAQAEPMTIRWYALQLGPSTFGIFDTFQNEEGRQTHLSGPIAQALLARAEELLAQPPQIQQVDLLAVK